MWSILVVFNIADLFADLFAHLFAIQYSYSSIYVLTD